MYVGGDFDIQKLKNAKGLEKLAIIGGDAKFSNLQSMNDLISLKHIDGTVLFKSLKNLIELDRLLCIDDINYYSNITEDKIESIIKKKVKLAHWNWKK